MGQCKRKQSIPAVRRRELYSRALMHVCCPARRSSKLPGVGVRVERILMTAGRLGWEVGGREGKTRSTIQQAVYDTKHSSYGTYSRFSISL